MNSLKLKLKIELGLLKLNLWSMEKTQLIIANKVTIVNEKPLKKINI